MPPEAIIFEDCMDDTLFTGYQALQLVALGPCLFIVYFLCICGRKPSQILVPVLFFLSLAASFTLPLQEYLGEAEQYRPFLQLLEAIQCVCSFLLIIQFATDRCPPLPYWSLLLVPLLGSFGMIYVENTVPEELCIWDDVCATAEQFHALYTILSSGMIFLLIVAIYHRLAKKMTGTEYQRTHKNALIFALIGLNLAVLCILLAHEYGIIESYNARVASSVVRAGFIYVVLTSLFRVFDNSLQLAYERIPTLRPAEPDEREKELAKAISRALSEDKIYRSSGMTRADMAKQFSVSEHHLSRVINQCLHQNFQTLLNHYRVNEARERLEKEDAAITDIAFDVGFASIPSFNRVFRTIVGLSPTEYRKLTQS